VKTEVKISEAIERACKKIAPLWSLKSFVAVNPFLGFSETSFHRTCATFRRVNRANVLMPRGFYREALDSQFIEDRDLQSALSLAALSSSTMSASFASVASFKEQLDKPAMAQKQKAVVATISEILDRLSQGDRKLSRTEFMVDEIAKFCASYYDEGQAFVTFPLKEQSLYSAWRQFQKYDRNPEFMGLKHFRESVEKIPTSPTEAIEFVVQALGIPARAVDDYLYRALFDINGWASYVRHLVWKSELKGEKNESLIELLAIRVVWGYALFLERSDKVFTDAWLAAMEEAAQLPLDDDLSSDVDLAMDLVLHEAYELAHQRRLFESLNKVTEAQSPLAQRPALQAAFCIDVRSEVFRRALEATVASVETIGFAGFFGIPLEFIGDGDEQVREQCPVLLKPAYKVSEFGKLRKRTSNSWKRFKQSAISCFAYVEAFGALSVIDIFRKTFRLSKGTVPSVGKLHIQTITNYSNYLNDAQKIQLAKSILQAMSLTKDFAPFVLLVGHGSSTANNPHASGLNCGACGGHSGEVNAVVLASLLNEATVREGLRAEGIEIPKDTWFLGALHDTTTDAVTTFGVEQVPTTSKEKIKEVQRWLSQAAELARNERLGSLVPGKENGARAEVFSRSLDWSQVRPEWGLAGNTAFIVGPRAFTKKVDLGGRAFLHNYDWTADKDFAVLELIMTAPMVVASWINLQYFASTTNNQVFGAGNKVLHNVTGTVGVIEGNSGDLRVGLPWQSVHNGSQFVHEPVRLNVIINAPVHALNLVIEKHANVRNLVDNKWVHLYSQTDDGRVSHKYTGGLSWSSILH
jgi:uncharacterized protein